MSSTGPIEAAEPDQIFKDKKFWIAQRCPTRSAFIDVIHFLGGELVPLEKQADHLIVDHLRESNPVGSISYKWIEDSYKKGTPQPLEDYLQGSPNRDSRASGSAKSSRTPFTPEDDRMLWNWVQDHEKIGGKALGNEIYKSLGQKNARHPWQSWRDRYVKHLQNKPPSGCQSHMPPPTPPSDTNVANTTLESERNESAIQIPVSHVVESTSTPWKTEYSDFTLEEFEQLLRQAPKISEVPLGAYVTKLWKTCERENPDHTADRWRSFYENVVLPAYLEQQEKEKQKEQLAEKDRETSAAEDAAYRTQLEEMRNSSADATTTRTNASSDESLTRRKSSSDDKLQQSEEQAEPDESNKARGTSNQTSNNADDVSADSSKGPTRQSKKRSLLNSAENSSSEKVSPSYANKKMRLQGSPPSSNIQQPQVMDLTSDEEEEEYPERAGPANDQNSHMPVRNMVPQNDTKSADIFGASYEDERGTGPEETPEMSNDGIQHEMEDGVEQAHRDGDESSESQSSFDPETSSAIARAMIGKRLKSASSSMQNTPQSRPRSMPAESARRRFTKSRSEYENSLDTAPDLGTPTTSRQVRTNHTGLSRSPYSTQRREKQAAPSVIQEGAECSGALPVSDDEGCAFPSEFYGQTADEEISYSQVQTSSAGFKSQQSALFAALSSARPHHEIFSEGTPTVDENESDPQPSSALDNAIERGGETQVRMSSVPADDEFIVQDQDESIEDSDYARSERVPKKADIQPSSGNETQAFFDARTQQPDLDLVEPPGGFDGLPAPRKHDFNDIHDDEDQETASVTSEERTDRAQHIFAGKDSVRNIEDSGEEVQPFVVDRTARLEREQNSHMGEMPDNDEESITTDGDETPKPQLRHQTVETQAFFDSDALDMMDLRLPSPDESFKLPALPSSPPVASSSQAEEQSQTTRNPETELADLNEWFADMEQAGHDWKILAEALQATSFDTGLVLQILPGLESGQGIPDDVKGVWTEEDDEQLEGTDARCLKRLSAKHGWKLMDERRKHLQEWRDGVDQSGVA